MPDFSEPTGTMPLETPDDRNAVLRRLQTRSEETKASLARLVDDVAAVKRQVKLSDDGNIEILKRLDKQDEVLNIIRDIMTTKKVGTRLLVWLGTIGAACYGIWQFWSVFKK